jgi:TonB family protein
MTEQRTGIMASLAVHAVFLSLLLILPTAGLTPIKTFQIIFERQETFPSDSVAFSNPAGAPRPVQMQNTKRQEIVAATTTQKRRDPTVQMSDKKPVLSVDKSGESVSATKDELKGVAPSGNAGSKMADNPASGGSSLARNVGNAAVVETRFGDADAPRFIHRELPIYPKLARRMEKEGKVVLKLLIDPAGKLLNIDVIENGAYGFTEAAIAAIKKSSFAPARRKGGNVASQAILPIRFKLE